MIIKFALALTVLLLTFALGWLVASSLKIRNQVEKIGLSILIGSLLLTVLMLFTSQITQVFTLELTILAPLIASVVIILILFIRKNINEIIPQINLQTFKKLTDAEKQTLIIIGVIVLANLWFNMTWPVTTWDSIALYDLRARVIQISGSWADGPALGYFYHYPPFTSLLHAALYLTGVEWVKVWYSILFLGFQLTFYSLLERRVSRIQALVGTFLLTIAPLIYGHITIAYTNLPYSIYFSLGLLYLWDWLDSRLSRNFILGFFLVAAGSWIRHSEPFWLVAIGLGLYGIIFKKIKISWKTVAVATLLFIGFREYWPAYTKDLPIMLDPHTLTKSNEVIRIPFTLGNIIRNSVLMIDYTIKYLFKPLFPLLLTIASMFAFDDKARQSKHLKLALYTFAIFIIMILGGTMLLSFRYKTWNQIGGSLTRLSMFIVPLFIFVISQSSYWKLLFGNKKGHQPKLADK